MTDVLSILKIIKNKKEEIKTPFSKFKIGVNILPNEYHQAFMIASTYGAEFIQLDYVSGTYGVNQRIDYDKYKRVRETYKDVKVLGGVWPKYYTPVEGSDLVTDVLKGMKRADAVVVTGMGTGKVTPVEKIMEFKKIVGQDYPIIIGAGLDQANVFEQLSIADGAIVGSSLKHLKRTTNPIDRLLVRDFMKEANKIR